MFNELELDAKAEQVAALRRLETAREQVTTTTGGAVWGFGDTVAEFVDAAAAVAAYTEFPPRRDFSTTEEWRHPRREP